MAEREHIKKRSTASEQDHDAEAVVEAKAEAADVSDLKKSLDDLLDEIDEVLEENAEEFVSNYVQKGGQ